MYSTKHKIYPKPKQALKASTRTRSVYSTNTRSTTQGRHTLLSQPLGGNSSILPGLRNRKDLQTVVTARNGSIKCSLINIVFDSSDIYESGNSTQSPGNVWFYVPVVVTAEAVKNIY